MTTSATSRSACSCTAGVLAREELAKYKPGRETTDKIVSVLQP